ncbi:hypothetical protein [Flavobacterium sp. GCM10027622]|uniref:hypothetical protein n=1 Tax=unclassified Flavobacterium TaxID=196869 RepID=UPI00361EFF5D
MKDIKTEIILIAILWINVISSLCLNLELNIYFIFGIIGLSLATITYRKYYDNSLAILITILLFSTFNLLKFTLIFNLSIGLLKYIEISITDSLYLILLVYKRRNEVIHLKEKWFAPSVEEIEIGKNTRIEFFKREFKNLSEDELNRKLNQEYLTEEARKAVLEVLQMKNSTEV